MVPRCLVNKSPFLDFSPHKLSPWDIRVKPTAENYFKLTAGTYIKLIAPIYVANWWIRHSMNKEVHIADHIVLVGINNEIRKLLHRVLVKAVHMQYGRPQTSSL